MKLLIAEDDATSRMMLNKAALNWGFEPILCEDGDSAWLAINDDDTPNLLLLDWEMPGVNGIEICERVRKRQDSNNFYIVVLTSRTTTEDLVTALENGANDYMRKPYTAEELQARLNVGRRMIELQRAGLKSDIENQRLQRQLNQSRKMESLGQVTGSIAHDFNNILGIIMGYTSMSLNRYGTEIPEKMVTYLEASLNSTERAKELVQKMLTFSYGATNHEPEPFQLVTAVKRAVKGYKNSLPDTVDIELLLHDDLPDVVFHEKDIDNVIHILCDNAFEAMPDGGTIQIKVSLSEHEDYECSACHKSFSGNERVCIEVIDQGTGIDKTIIERIFEPFYTTKEFGKGMGLAMLHGMMRNADTHSTISSLSPNGTRVRVLFPSASN